MADESTGETLRVFIRVGDRGDEDGVFVQASTTVTLGVNGGEVLKAVSEALTKLAKKLEGDK